MNIYTINCADTGSVIEIVAVSDEAAIRAVRSRLGQDVVIADQWDADGTNDDGVQMWRLLIWDSEADAENDCGQNSIAQLTRVGSERVITRSSKADRHAWVYACQNQGYDGTFDDWCFLSAAERQEYENGAAGAADPKTVV